LRGHISSPEADVTRSAPGPTDSSENDRTRDE
jgi:hypothetical protein